MPIILNTPFILKKVTKLPTGKISWKRRRNSNGCGL
jgi:hypothetical protein